MEAFDATDLEILGVLQEDGRAPFSAIARRLELPESTVRSRARRLLDGGRIAIVATGDPLALGIPIDALCTLRVDPREVRAAAAAVAALPAVRYVGVALGGRELIVESLHPDTAALHRYLSEQLPSISGVEEVESRQIVEIVKSVWDWRSWLAELAAPDPGDPEEAPA